MNDIAPHGRQRGGSLSDHTRLDSSVTSNNKFWIDNNGRLQPVKYSFVKIIKTNNHIEVHEAQFPFILDRKPNNKANTCSNASNKTRNKEYRYRNAKRAMDRIRRLAGGNFVVGETKHLVLTFRDGLNFDIKDISPCNKRFNSFSQKVHKKYKDFKYIKVAEFQDKNGRGAVHYHTMCNLPFVIPEDIAKMWGYGYVKIKRPPEDIAKYLFKYLIKNAGDERYKNKRSWSHSKNLETTKTFYQQKANQIRGDLCDRNLAPNYQYSYDSKFNGRIHVTEYDLNNPIPRSTAQPIKPFLPKKDDNDRE